jgi:DtxR family Mn-dependent transcriptional regulator
MVSRREEDYLEAILGIISEKGYARNKDIANSLDIKPASVSDMLKVLHSKDLIIYLEYEGARLTEKGLKIAK